MFCTTRMSHSAIGVATMSVPISAVSPTKSLKKKKTYFSANLDCGPRERSLNYGDVPDLLLEFDL